MDPRTHKHLSGTTSPQSTSNSRLPHLTRHRPAQALEAALELGLGRKDESRDWLLRRCPRCPRRRHRRHRASSSPPFLAALLAVVLSAKHEARAGAGLAGAAGGRVAQAREVAQEEGEAGLVDCACACAFVRLCVRMLVPHPSLCFHCTSSPFPAPTHARTHSLTDRGGRAAAPGPSRRSRPAARAAARP